jgi:NADPH:quinone reductase-like Zn-dependent oxidoreductase
MYVDSFLSVSSFRLQAFLADLSWQKKIIGNFIPGKTRVFGAGQGAYAEKIAAEWQGLIEIPAGMSYDEAAGLFITYPTSYAALVNRANIQPGEFLLIHACAGGKVLPSRRFGEMDRLMMRVPSNLTLGVGLAALQIGKALGAIVIATASSPEKLAICKKYGADHVINYSGEPSVWQKEVMRITKGKGVDVVYDPVGMIIPSLKVIAWSGRIVVVGFAGGNIEKIPSNLVSHAYLYPAHQLTDKRSLFILGSPQEHRHHWSTLGASSFKFNLSSSIDHLLICFLAYYTTGCLYA